MKLLLAAIIFSGSLSASIVPENSLQIPTGMKSGGGITELQFNSVISKIETIYSPIVYKTMGKKLVMSRQWEDPTVNASAAQDDDEAVLNLFGGLARFPSMTADSFALVVCHELGHHIGGAPKFISHGWATIESQSDYFATLKCLRRVFLNDDNSTILKNRKVPAELTEMCAKSFADKTNRHVCVRSGLASLELQKLLIMFTGDKIAGLISTPDETKVPETSDEHSTAQCRLDTFLQGSICGVPFNVNVSQTDEVAGTCHKLSGYKTGLRPRCWFKPRAK